MSAEFHYGRTVPEGARPETVRAWEAMWARIRRTHKDDVNRRDAVRGMTLKICGRVYYVRFSRKQITESCWKEGFFVRELGTREHMELFVRGTSAYGYGKPYTNFVELQGVLDRIDVAAVMTG